MHSAGVVLLKLHDGPGFHAEGSPVFLDEGHVSVEIIVHLVVSSELS